MTKLVATNKSTNTAIVASDGTFVYIDTEKKDVIGTSPAFESISGEGWDTQGGELPALWAELAEAETTNFNIGTVEHADSDRVFRVPKNVQKVSKTFTDATATLNDIHTFAVSRSREDKIVKHWVNKVTEKYPVPEAIVAAGFVPTDTAMYFGRAVAEDTTECDAMYSLDQDGNWAERIDGSWVPVQGDPGAEFILIMLDPDTSAELADWADQPDELDGGSLELAALNPDEAGLFYAAESELDFEMIDRLFDVYDSQERSVNAHKQVRGQGGRFGGSPGGGEGTADKPKARLAVSLPLIPNIASRIDEYLAQVSKDRGDAAPVPSSGQAPAVDPKTDNFAVTAQQAGVPETDAKPLYIAIVDDVDVDAVLDLVSLVPPAKGAQGDVTAWKRAAGQWVAANDILAKLRGSTPPSCVEISDPAILKQVVEQVDKSTADEVDPENVPGQTEVGPNGTPEAAPKPAETPGAPVKTSNLNLEESVNLTTDSKEAIIAAASGAMKDGSYPIANKEDLKNAIQAYGRAKNKTKAKAHIISRARKLKATDLLPVHWEFSTAPVDLGLMAARGYAYSDGSLLIRSASELSRAVKDANDREQELHVIKRARALNRLDLIPQSWDPNSSYTSDTLWGPYGELLPISAAGGADRNRGGAEKLRHYWTKGLGGVKIGWGSPRDGTRCIAYLSKYLGPRAVGYCQLRHFEMNGYYMGDKRNR